MLEGDIYSRAYAGEASQHLDAALARLVDQMDDPGCMPCPPVDLLPSVMW